jgi:MFS family permease
MTSATLSDRSRSLTLFAACLGFAVAQLDVSVVNVAIKPIGEELGGGIGGLRWLATLIAARVVQGIGAAVLVPCSPTLLNHMFSDPDDRARAVGLSAAGASVALADGPLIGGLLIASLGWRAIFFINAPIGAIGILTTLRWAPETMIAATRPRPIGLRRPSPPLVRHGAVRVLVRAAVGFSPAGRLAAGQASGDGWAVGIGRARTIGLESRESRRRVRVSVVTRAHSAARCRSATRC